jgi:hypothetical protein
MLDVVEDDVCSPAAHGCGERADRGVHRAECLSECRREEVRVAERSEWDEHRPAGGLVGEQPRELNREACLADAARAQDRQNTRIALEHHRDRLDALLFPADKGRGRRRQLDTAFSPDGRELAGSELVEAGVALEIP